MERFINNIQIYREAAQLSQQELGEKVGVARQTISAWEQGIRDVSVAQLARIGRALHVPLGLLLSEPDPADFKLLFRADSPKALTPSYRQLVAQKVEDYAQLEHIVGEIPVLPMSMPLTDFKQELIEEVSQRTRDWLGVDDAPLGDVLALIEAKGLKLLLEKLPAAVSGFSATSEQWGSVIVVNATHPRERQYFTALHELGHLIFHRSEYDGNTKTSQSRRDPREKIANYFAGAMLLPRGLMEREFRGYKLGWIPDVLLNDLKLKYGVSMRTILFRAGALGIISQKQAGQQVGVLNKRFGIENEPVILPEPSKVAQTRLERLTYRALLQEDISTSRAAEILGAPLSDIRRSLMNYLTNPAG